MPFWTRPYKIRRSTQILSYAVKQLHTLLETGGEACYLLKRLRRSNASFQLEDRRVLTQSVVASSYTTDPDTGMMRYKIWGGDTHDVDDYPDIGVLTCTIESSGGVTSVWEPAVDKYSFVEDQEEYAFDIFHNQLDSTGSLVEDAVYIVFNTPPFRAANTATLNFGNVNPSVHFESMQPRIDNQEGFQNSLFAFDQWLDPDIRVRTIEAPNQFLLAFPGVLTDFTITEGGLLRKSESDFWTGPPPYSPEVVEHDVVVRESTGQRFQIVNYTPIYLENILVSQHFGLSELNPLSTIYNIVLDT